MTPLGFMQITTLAQGITNLINQFVKIVLKILALNLYNQTKLFLKDVGIKGVKTIYNNEELAFAIRQYVIEHIQNLDQVLANLEQAEMTIAKAKSQFCQVSIKIVRYIYNIDAYYPNTSKVSKILN